MSPVGELVQAAAVVLVVLAGAGLAVGVNPRWRRRVAMVMPAVLGAACLAVGTALAESWDRTAVWDRIAFGAGGEPRPAVTAAVCLGGVVVVALLFHLEGGLSRAWERWRWARLRSVNVPGFFGVDLPGRGESMRDVADVARRPVVFTALSGWSAVMEEYFYRGVLLLGAVGTGPPVAALLFVQAGCYGLNHVAFGPPALLGKTLLGAALGGAALLGGVLPAVVGHAAYQVLVFRQFPRTASAGATS